MSQYTMPAAHDYEMPSLLLSALVRGSTWQLFCRDCERFAYPDVIDLLERFGDRFKSDILWRRSTCRACGGRMTMCGGMFVKRLQDAGDLSSIAMPPLGDGQPLF